MAPDYLLVSEKVKEEFLAWIVFWIEKMLGKEPLENPDYPKMINEKHYQDVYKRQTRFGMSDEFDMVAMETVSNQYLGGDASLACSFETLSLIHI